MRFFTEVCVVEGTLYRFHATHLDNCVLLGMASHALTKITSLQFILFIYFKKELKAKLDFFFHEENNLEFSAS